MSDVLTATPADFARIQGAIIPDTLHAARYAYYSPERPPSDAPPPLPDPVALTTGRILELDHLDALHGPDTGEITGELLMHLRAWIVPLARNAFLAIDELLHGARYGADLHALAKVAVEILRAAAEYLDEARHGYALNPDPDHCGERTLLARYEILRAVGAAERLTKTAGLDLKFTVYHARAAAGLLKG